MMSPSRSRPFLPARRAALVAAASSAAPAPTQPPPTTTTSNGVSCLRRSTCAARPGMRSSDEGVMEPAPIGAAKDGAAGSVIVAKRAPPVGCSGAPVVLLRPCSHPWFYLCMAALLKLLALEDGVFAQSYG